MYFKPIKTFKSLFLTCCILGILIFWTNIFADEDLSPFGFWMTLDDKTQQPRSIVELENVHGFLEGRIVKVFYRPGEGPNDLCVNCSGKFHDLRILGLTSPDFFMKELATGFRKTPYDVAKHYHLRNVALAKITKDFGWDARNSFEKEALEYYLLYRYLKFEKFEIELRDTILNTLNAGLELIGKQLGFDTKILVNGLPTLDTVQTSYSHLQRGDVTFREVLEPFQGF